MAELKNCRRCNRVFPYVAGLRVCRECQLEEERAFEKVSLYVREHPGVPIPKIAEELDLSLELLMKYVREGRLQIMGADGKSVNYCEKCGKALSDADANSGGKLCKQCGAGITNALDVMKQGLEASIAHGQNQSAFLRHTQQRR